MFIEFGQKELGLKLLLPARLQKKIHNHVEKYFPKESGGIFLGHYADEGKIAIIDSIVIPKLFDSSAINFTRRVDDINMIIKKQYEKSNGCIDYIGEWHSHPNCSNNFSEQDYKTMQEISRDANVKITTPILQIVSVYEGLLEDQVYVFHKNKLFPYELYKH
ncbi:MAG: Mov34/MPN/PAD-1 family protein [Bacteroidetes bacterium]|nr:Mov34/MPN/PAD-1 family protein [Bacteroidota bacterium]